MLCRSLALALSCSLLGGCDTPRGPVTGTAASASVEPAARPEAAEQSRHSECVRAGRRCDIALAGCQRELFGVVECLYGTAGAPRPPVRFVAAEALAAELRAEDERLARRRAGLAYAAERLGLGDTQAEAVRSEAAGPNAYYAAERREISIVQRDALPTDGELAWLVLAHEYVHALQDRHGELGRALRTRHERTFDEDLALFAGFEGEAALFEQVLRALHDGQRPARWAVERFEAEAAWNDDAVLGQSRLLESSFGTFPYGYGALWAARRWLDAPAARLDRRSVPRTTYEFLARRHGWAFPALALPACPRRPVPGKAHVEEQSLGAWLIQSFVRKQTHDAVLARSLASAARGDSLSVYAEPGTGELSFVWRSAWASEADAEAMSRLVEARLRTSARTEADFAVRVRGQTLLAVVLGPSAGSASADRSALQELAACAGAPR